MWKHMFLVCVLVVAQGEGSEAFSGWTVHDPCIGPRPEVSLSDDPGDRGCPDCPGPTLPDAFQRSTSGARRCERALVAPNVPRKGGDAR